MEQVVVIYSIVVALLAALIIFIVLVNKNVIMKYSNNVIKRVLTKPLVMYSLRRIASAVISFALAIVVTFCLLRIQDKNLLCTKETGWKKFSAEIREMLCERKLDSLGLNDPLIVQILNYFYQIIPFPKKVCISHTTTSTFEYICSNSQMMIVNFGRTTELGKNESIAGIFNRTMPVSMKIGLGGLAIEMIIGYPMGVFMAKYKNKWFDKLGNAYIILVGSIPSLVYFYLLQAILVKGFNLPLRWTSSNPTSGLAPMITLGIGGIAGIALWVRRYMVDEFGSDYVKFARAKGVPENTILFKHVLRNAVVPLVRSIPSGIIYCLLGSYFVEKIYGVEGFGQLLISGINAKDYNVVQAVVVVSAIISIFANLLGDITTAIADPRVSFSSND